MQLPDLFLPLGGRTYEHQSRFLCGNILSGRSERMPDYSVFLTSFFIVYAVFGLQYSIVVSVLTVFFQTRYKKRDNALSRYLHLLTVGTCLILLAYVSSKNLLFCVILNLFVPFVLVFTQSSQFNPKGYFSYAMLFVFLELVPPENGKELVTELLIFWLGVFYLILTIGLYGRFFLKPEREGISLRRGFHELSELLSLLPIQERQEELERRFENLLHDFHQISYHRKFFYRHTRENQRYDMFSTLIQRFSYLIADDDWREDLGEDQILLLERLSDFLKTISEEFETGAYGKWIWQAQQFLTHMPVSDGRVKIFCRSFLHMLILILKNLSGESQVVAPVDRQRLKELFHQIWVRRSPESFEMRFAMRLSMVLVISCAIGFLLPITKPYWIPLNAFLLIQPSHEDSSYRMKTRPIGTLIGCFLEFCFQMVLPGMWWEIGFALVMVSLMYCSTPGTWYQPIFSTCYALTMASMTLDEQTAITLRIVYLGAAVAIVFLVNRFFFPMRKEIQFRHNLKSLFRLHNDYWELIRKGVTGTADLSITTEILTYFHTIYEECSAYLKKNPEYPGQKELQKVLIRLWHMFAELEQVFYLVQTGSIFPEEKGNLIHLIDSVQEDLYPIIRYEKIPQLRKEIRYREPGVGYVLKRYLKHAEALHQYRECIPF